MIQYWINEDDDCKANVEISPSSAKSTFFYPCTSSVTCKPYLLFLKRGTYKIELWGAQGGDARLANSETMQENIGGKGGYVSGIIRLTQSTQMYLFVGGRGQDQNSTEQYAYGKGGYNGGGDGGIDLYDSSLPESGAGGGGSTDIRLTDNQTNPIISLKSRIMVAAGGGGSASVTHENCQYTIETDDDLLCENKEDFITEGHYGGAAGGLTGYRTNSITFPGNQTCGSFGKGEKGLSSSYLNLSLVIYGGAIGGGGGGYFGGTSINNHLVDRKTEVGGAGGSSYVSGCIGCRSVNFLPSDDTNTTSSVTHYSKSGIEEFDSPKGIPERGHSGSGAAAITYLGLNDFAINYKMQPLSYILIFICLTTGK